MVQYSARWSLYHTTADGSPYAAIAHNLYLHLTQLAVRHCVSGARIIKADGWKDGKDEVLIVEDERRLADALLPRSCVNKNTVSTLFTTVVTGLTTR